MFILINQYILFNMKKSKKKKKILLLLHKMVNSNNYNKL